MARRQGQLGLFREEQASPALSCRDLFPDQGHCSHCHDADTLPLLATSQRGVAVTCCCQGVALMVAFKLAGDHWTKPATPDHEGRMAAWTRA